MSGDYEKREINQPKITYLENNTELVKELINKIKDIKNKIFPAT